MRLKKRFLCILLFYFQIVTILASNKSSSFNLGETAIGMDRDLRMNMEKVCTSKTRFSVKTAEKTHNIRLEGVIAGGVHGVVCTARSTKSLVPKGGVYAVKISIEEMHQEALFLSRMQHLPEVITCLWECRSVQFRHLTQTKLRGVTVPITRQFFALPMEYFPAPSIREWLREMSLPLQPPTPWDARLELFRRQDVRTAYAEIKSAALHFWYDGWIHRDMHVGNFLWQIDTHEIRIIDVAMATKFSYHNIGQLEWMHNVGRDFRFFAYTFGLAIMCPEEWLTPPPGSDPTVPNPRAKECIDFSEIIPLMRQFDPEFNMVINFMVRGHRYLNLLPPRFQQLARKFAPRVELTGGQLIQSVSDRLSGVNVNGNEQPQRIVSSALIDISVAYRFATCILLILLFVFLFKLWKRRVLNNSVEWGTAFILREDEL